MATTAAVITERQPIASGLNSQNETDLSSKFQGKFQSPKRKRIVRTTASKKSNLEMKIEIANAQRSSPKCLDGNSDESCQIASRSSPFLEYEQQLYYDDQGNNSLISPIERTERSLDSFSLNTTVQSISVVENTTSNNISALNESSSITNYSESFSPISPSLFPHINLNNYL